MSARGQRPVAIRLLPGPLAAHVEAWLASNQKEPDDVRWGSFPLGMVQRWIERAEDAEATVAESAAVSERESNLGESVIRAMKRLEARGRGCVCDACVKDGPHASDCAVHNEPAAVPGECDCRLLSCIQPCCKEEVVAFREIDRSKLTEDDILALIAIAEQAREVVYNGFPADDLLEKVEAFELRAGEGVRMEVEA